MLLLFGCGALLMPGLHSPRGSYLDGALYLSPADTGGGLLRSVSTERMPWLALETKVRWDNNINGGGEGEETPQAPPLHL